MAESEKLDLSANNDNFPEAVVSPARARLLEGRPSARSNLQLGIERVAAEGDMERVDDERRSPAPKGRWRHISERLARLEGAEAGTRQSHTTLLTASFGLGAVLVAALALIYTNVSESRSILTSEIARVENKIDKAAEAVEQMPDRLYDRLSAMLNSSILSYQAGQQDRAPAGAPEDEGK